MQLSQRNRWFFSFALGFLTFLSACDSNPVKTSPQSLPPPPPPPTLEELIAMTPRENAEAEAMALMLGDDLVAPEKLYREMVDDLILVREQFGDSIPLLRKLQYFPYATPGVLFIGLTDSAVAAIRSGTYTSLYSLNSLLNANPIDTNHFGWKYSYLVLRFEGRLKGSALEELYDTIPGIRYAQRASRIGDWSNIYPWTRDGKRTFLLRYAYGDCPAGCGASDVHYFIKDGDRFRLLGVWSTWFEGFPPAWWEDFIPVLRKYWGIE